MISSVNSRLSRRLPAPWLYVPIFAAIVAAGLITNCSKEASHTNLVLIGVDTLRPDHLGCYGYERPTSPNIDRLAGRGILFQKVMSHSPWTLPSFATVFTSLYPSEHGATGSRTAMRTGFPTLATVLKAHGFATGAVVNAPYLKGRYRTDRGFDFYDMTPPGGRVADGTTDDALAWIDENSEGPFFMFVHYFDPHIPYGPPAPYDTIFDPDYRGTVRTPFNPEWLPRSRLRGFSRAADLSDEDREHVKALYDGEVAFTDRAIGALLDGLDERGLTRNTLIVFLSDHGEEFFEHGGFEHGHTLYEELLRVPLVLSQPDRLAEGLRIPGQVRLVDVMPTLLDLLGIDSPGGLEGESLAGLIGQPGVPPGAEPASRPGVEPGAEPADQPGALPEAEPGAEFGAEPPDQPGRATGEARRMLPAEYAYAEALLYGNELKSITAYPWKLIYEMQGGGISLFNLERDPGELRNLAGTGEGAQTDLEQQILRTVLSLSDTWHVEMGGNGEPHGFGLRIAADVIPGSGHIKISRLIASDGTILPVDAVGVAGIGPSRIDLQDIVTTGPLALVFQPTTMRAPVKFDLYLDGKPASSRTFIGSSRERPVTMPFLESAEGPDDAAFGRPVGEPEGPYFNVWVEPAPYREDATIDLDDETTKELKALGYIQ